MFVVENSLVYGGVWSLAREAYRSGYVCAMVKQRLKVAWLAVEICQGQWCLIIFSSSVNVHTHGEQGLDEGAIFSSGTGMMQCIPAKVVRSFDICAILKK